jgi:hypothetical protein
MSMQPTAFRLCGDGAAGRERRDKIAAALEEQTEIQSAAE